MKKTKRIELRASEEFLVELERVSQATSLPVSELIRISAEMALPFIERDAKTRAERFAQQITT